ncbi:MAG: glycosyltransferase [Planctomycetota bacterium]|jgi:hypothetical protein
MGIDRLRIIVTGLVGLYPVGGVAWDYLQYIIGLSRLGYEVYYHEDTWSWPYHPLEKRHTSDGSYSAKYICDFFEQYAPELKEKWHYFHLHETDYGMTSAAFKEVVQTADLFLNVSGACSIPDHLSDHCKKVFLDTDPGYNQIVLSERFAWSENVDRWCKTVDDHDMHLTYAENINALDCLIPKLNFYWKTTRMPIVIDLWKYNERTLPVGDTPWTTIMTWNAFKGKLLYQGQEYMSKGTEFKKIIELPHYVQVPLKVAVGGVNAPVEQLERYGWQVVDGPSATITPGDYQRFIVRSRGELSIAKNVYVEMRSGWFSCRSACYLAAGKPVVVQDTGFGNVLPTGEGLFAFNTMEEILTAFEAVNSDYEKHSRAARDIAEEYFRSETVLSKLLNDLGL